MGDADLIRIEERTASEVCRKYAPSAEAVALLADGPTPRAFLDRLIAGEHFADAEAFLAHALSKREAVWWACQCVRHVIGPEPPPKVAEALKVAEEWATVPGDENRRKAMPAAEAVGFDHPAGCVALAAFLSGGSLAPPTLEEVPPADHLTATAVAGAVQMAAVLSEPANAPEKHRRLLKLGIDVARGVNRWKEVL